MSLLLAQEPNYRAPILLVEIGHPSEALSVYISEMLMRFRSFIFSFAVLSASLAAVTPPPDTFSSSTPKYSYSVARLVSLEGRGLSYPIASVDFSISSHLKNGIDELFHETVA
ncbi:hypothetical protein GYMLUDRAFT_76619 [Collybiopsis luxurians FD-317 M1]|uniref:Uncharacterized protein n=1 Tax=Collybiopsis luxurians FD-317 M1 TaxID=944289 RepID=A0A0D0BZA8_9AGAR|nr:hypothetical protein GYMLUDRAFT_76619 [Collybiopsis luxurians FD-317 M1]